MSKQLSIFDQPKNFNMAEAKTFMLLAEIENLKATIQKQANTIRTYKGHETRKQNKNNEQI